HLGLAQKTGGRALDAAALVGLELVLELLARLGQLCDRLGHALWRDAERRRRAHEPVACLAHLPERADPGHGLDAPDARADRLLLRDEKEPDVAGAVAMRSAAQLAAVAVLAGLDHTDLVVVLLAEERHRARRERLLERHRPRV